MPEEHKAASTVVQPTSPHLIKILEGVYVHEGAAKVAPDVGTAFEMGLEMGLTLAADYPDVYRDILAAIDTKNAMDDAGRTFRASSARVVGEAARGRNVDEIRAEIGEEIAKRPIDGPSFSWN